MNKYLKYAPFYHCYIILQITRQDAEWYKEKCTLDNSHGQTTTSIYILTQDKFEKIANGVFENTYGSPLVQQQIVPEKVIMLVGATGKGKSTLINRMINHIFGVKYCDEFRFQLVVEKEISQIDSQTKDITKYVMYLSKPSPLKLIIIDTPGFGDTAGRQEDRIKVEKIKNLFKSGTIVCIDAICFVANYNEPRLTDYHSYVFATIANVFGNDVEGNIFIMTTFCDGTYSNNKFIKPAPTLEAIMAADIPFKASFPFNNKDIYTKPGDEIDSLHWKTSRISFELFFECLDQTIPVSLQLSRDILEKQHNIIHAQLPNFVRKLKDSIHTIDEHKENLKGIEMELKNPGKDFTYEVKIEELVMEDIEEPNIFCTKCERCESICHYPCTLKKDCDLWWCHTMSWFNLRFEVYCTVCQCSWKNHKRVNKRPVRRTVKEIRTNEDLKQIYLNHKGDEKLGLMKSCENKMVSAYGDLLKDLRSIQECIDFINNKCLSKHLTTLEQYINDIIDKEKKFEEDGYLKRIKALRNLITYSKQANEKNMNEYEAFNQSSDEEKLQQAMQVLQGNEM